MHSLTDKELMRKYQEGEAKVMNELLRRYKNPVYHFAYRLSADAIEAEDVAQEVFLRLHQYKDSYRPTGKFTTWLFAITHNLCMSRFRKRKWLVAWPRRKDDPEKLVEFESPDLSPRETVVKNEFRETLKESIQGLPFLQKEALILREYQKLDYNEISKILKKSLGTVKTLIHRARMNLKDKLLPYIEESRGGCDE